MAVDTAGIEGLFDLAPDLLGVVDAAGRLRRLNAAWEAVLGVPVPALEGLPELELVHPDDREITLAARCGLRAGGEPALYSSRCRHRDGTYRTVLWRAAVGPDGESLLLCGREESLPAAAEALPAAAELFAAFMSHCPAIAFIKDAEGRLLYVNPTFERAFSMRLADWQGKTDFELWPPETARQLRANDLAILAGGQPVEIEETVERPEGTEHWLSCKFPLADGHGRQLLAGMAVQLTDRMRAEQRLRTVVAGAHCLLWLGEVREVDGEPDWVLTMWDEEAAQRFLPLEVPPNGNYDDAWFASKDPEDRLEMSARGNSALRRGLRRYQQEFRCRQKDGAIRWLWEDVHIEPAGPGRWRLVGVCTDITERKHAEAALLQREEQLRQSQKMEAIGRLAGGIAHDFNNMLGVILGYCDLLLKQQQPEEVRRAYLTEMRTAGERAAGLTRQLLAYSRKQLLAPEMLDLGQVVRRLEQMLQRLIGEHITLETRIPRASVWVKADRGQIEQVLLNLVVNARDAMPDGGRLTLTLDCRELDADAAAGPPELPPGRYAAVTVADTGVGIAAGVLPRVFEPFFTTKPVGEGTGLGLATVYGIMTQSGGRVEVESEPGQGARFRILLPQLEGPPPGYVPRGRRNLP